MYVFFLEKKNHPTTTICFASSRVCVRVRARERKRERERVYGRVGVRACTCMCVRLIFVLLFRASYKENSTTELLVDWTCVVFFCRFRREVMTKLANHKKFNFESHFCSLKRIFITYI